MIDTDDTDDTANLSTALHARAGAEHPDLDRLVAGSMISGRRLRRRRRAALVAGSALAVAAVSAGAFYLTSSTADQTRNAGVEFATGDSPSAETSPSPSGSPTLANLGDQPVPPLAQPFTIDPPAGWSCGDGVDDKFDCTRGPADVHVVIRRGESRQDYAAGAPGKEIAAGGQVTDVHGGVFLTLEPYGTATADDVQMILDSITWTD